MSHAHALIIPTAVVGIKRCGYLNCKVAGKVERPALSQEHSETSKGAARAIEGGPRSKARNAVLAAIAQSPYGLTAQEISDQTGIVGDTVRPRIVELVERNQIKDSGKVRLTKAGRLAVVYIARHGEPT